MRAASRATAGLSSAEASRRLARDGPNLLPTAPRPSWVRRLADQLVHLFALMLWVAAVLAVVAGMPQLGAAIVVVVLLNAGFAFVQETRANRAADALQDLLPRAVTVHRDGRPTRVEAEQLVVGDVVVLEAGDRVPADVAVVQAHAALVDTSMLTGESAAGPVEPGEPLFAGTYLVEGEVEAEVTATGAATRLAAISQMTTAAARPSSPLTDELRRVVKVIAVLSLGVGVGFFGLSLALGQPASEGFLFGIGVVVALVPEALLPTVTLSLAWGAEQMAKRGVLVRSLEAVETLGSTTFICTDKTGTLTCNQMTVVHAWTPSGAAVVDDAGYEVSVPVVLGAPADRPAIERLAAVAVRASTGHLQLGPRGPVPHGDPMEVAIDVFARRLGVDSDGVREGLGAARRFPFDPRRRRMSVVVDGEVDVKGAPDAVLPLCRGDDAEVRVVLESLTRRGLRVLAVATRVLGRGDAPRSASDAERELELCGLLAMEDPPRAGVREAVAAARRAGMRLAMVTGDHPMTARAIASEVGLLLPEAPLVSGSELPNDDVELGALVDHDGTVVARVAPEDKLRIARALRARGHVVAMTGDGVNDGPALHEAHLGVAMGGSGTDVAREAADLVVLDDRFESIVAGIEQGRSTFLNIRRFLTYHLTDNVAELTPFVVWALSAGRIPLALSVLQVLALDVGTDTLSAVALGAEPPPADVLEQPPIRGHLLSGSVVRRAFLILGPTEAALGMLAFFATFLAGGWRPGAAFPSGRLVLAASAATFLAVVAAQMANASACRSATRPPWRLGWTTNRLLLPAVAYSAAVAVLTIGIGPVAHLLRQAPPTSAGWAVVLVAPVVLLGVDALVKARWARRGRGA
jgi:calcium-translocating P-type ATPase